MGSGKDTARAEAEESDVRQEAGRTDGRSKHRVWQMHSGTGRHGTRVHDRQVVLP